MKSLEDFARETQSLDCAAFLAAHPHPVLLLDPRRGRLDAGGVFRPLLPQVLMTGVDEEAHGAAKSDPAAMRLIPIVKVRDQRFPELITLGRGAENDVVMSNPSLSKIHVFFNCKEGDCTIVDSRSTNGTVVNGAVLSSIVPVSLETGAVIVFGGAFHATFNWAEDLFEYIEVLRIAKKL